MITVRALALVALATTAAVRAGPAPEAADPCGTFERDVRHERALFAGEAQPLSASRTAERAPAVRPDHLYDLQLHERGEVSFAVPPAQKHPATGGYAGLVRLEVHASGMYRVALDQGFWIDVIANGVSIRSSDFEGRHGCAAPHKIVEFMLPSDTPLILQLSGGALPKLRLTVTRAAPPVAVH